MEGSELSDASLEKNLGVWILADMKCSKQCMYAFNKATKILGMIKRTIRFKDTKAMLSLIKHLLGPMLNIVLVLGIHTIKRQGVYTEGTKEVRKDNK